MNYKNQTKDFLQNKIFVKLFKINNNKIPNYSFLSLVKNDALNQSSPSGNVVHVSRDT